MTVAASASPRRDPIRLLPYDPRWPALFERERTRVESALRAWLVGPVEHIGSTAVPGLAAKPIIDMLARITNYQAPFQKTSPEPLYETGPVGADIASAMMDIGWVPAPEPHDRDTRTWSFCFPDTAWRTHHLHVVEHASTGWPTWLAFRDHLRGHPADAERYARIKTELAALDDQDRPAYRAGKAPFIVDLVRRVTETGGYSTQD